MMDSKSLMLRLRKRLTIYWYMHCSDINASSQEPITYWPSRRRHFHAIIVKAVGVERSVSPVGRIKALQGLRLERRVCGYSQVRL
jgi:hypothetical protein